MPLVSTAADYLRSLIKCVPGGLTFPQSPDSNWYKLLDAFSQEFARIDADANRLVTEAFPTTTDELLENWERVVGLPDACTTGSETVDQRRAAVLAKLVGRGGGSVDYFLNVILAMGYTVTITELFGFIIGESIMGTPLSDDDMAFGWLITAPTSIPDHASFECSINLLKPAHTKALFNYV